MIRDKMDTEDSQLTWEWKFQATCRLLGPRALWLRGLLFVSWYEVETRRNCHAENKAGRTPKFFSGDQCVKAQGVSAFMVWPLNTLGRLRQTNIMHGLVFQLSVDSELSILYGVEPKIFS